MAQLTEYSLFQWLVLAIVTLMACLASFHALTNKSDSHSAFGWIAVCVLFPAVGPLLYLLFGVNRIHRRARRLEAKRRFHIEVDATRAAMLEPFVVPHDALPPSMRPIARVAGTLTGRPLLCGNRVEALHDGENTYPAMLEAIASAERSVFLSTYIFQPDCVGLEFVEALGGARRRGVDVRVLVDGVGELYALPSRISTQLAKHAIPVARFLPPMLFPPMLSLNLRSHRKSMIVDGRVGFTGGMNLAQSHLRGGPAPPPRVSDVHYRIHGPVVAQLEHAFLEDWHFCTGVDELPPHSHPLDPAAPAGQGKSRVVVSGPNEPFANIAALFTAAISLAQNQIIIVTPYFLPTRGMVEAIRIAALRGVQVDVLLPARSNLRFVDWATRQMLWEVLEVGVQVWYQPAPFVHTKLFLVDGQYALFGSANMDPRSLRLNFELDMELYGREPVAPLVEHAQSMRQRSCQVTLAEVSSRSTLERVRDGVAWLFSPYL